MQKKIIRITLINYQFKKNYEKNISEFYKYDYLN